MICPGCGLANQNQVIDSRPRSGGGIRRRRECLVCGHRWSTVEIPIDEAAVRAEEAERILEKALAGMNRIQDAIDSAIGRFGQQK